jgi:holo-[acyl-carrier protein] synthase
MLPKGGERNQANAWECIVWSWPFGIGERWHNASSVPDSNLMIIGTGIDIAEVPRVQRAIERFGDRFLRRIYTPGEIRYCESKANRVERYAARFAAKEAAMKALGTGWNHGVRWRDCEVARLPGGRPTISFHGRASELAARLGVKNAALSISHTAEQAIAQVILES